MHYELWNMRTGNLLGTWESETEVYAYVRQHIERHGAESTRSWTLAYETEADETTEIASGDGLAQQAFSEFVTPA